MRDCVVVGGGPAGLTAALYLARFNKSVSLFDTASSRLRSVPKLRNLPFFPDGVSGEDLLRTMRKALSNFGVAPCMQEVADIERGGDGFTLTLGDGSKIRSRFVILATGVLDVKPPLEDVGGAVVDGLVRYCPICDGYEASGRRVAIAGTRDRAMREAKFLRDVYGVNAKVWADASDRSGCRGAREGDELYEGPCDAYTSMWRNGNAIEIADVSGAISTFETLYAAFGVTPRLECVKNLAGNVNEVGCLVTGDCGETSVSGLFAAGDVISKVDQVACAVGQGAEAAIRINALLLPSGR